MCFCRSDTKFFICPCTKELFFSILQGTSIVLKDYDMLPEVSTTESGLMIAAGESCDGTGTTTGSPTSSPTASTSGGALAAVGLSSLFLGGPAIVTAASFFLAAVPFANAEDMPSITVDIYMDADQLLHEESLNTECPVETAYWKHHDSVFGGYEGCVSEKYLYPCGQYARPEDPWNTDKLPLAFVDGECVETGYTMEDRTFWILWGDPLDVSP